MAAYTYEELKKTYADFENPVAVLSVDGKDFSGNTDGLVLNDLNIELTAGFEASVASFCLYNTFDAAEDTYRFDAFKSYAQLGAEAKISLGYAGNARTVFSGVIVRTQFLQESYRVPYVQVTAMDVKGLMMSSCFAKQLKAKSYGAAVKEIFNRSPYSSFKLSADDTPDAQSADSDTARTIEMVNESDYEFVVKAAKRYSYEFFADSTTVYFRKAKKNKEILMELARKEGLLEFDIGYDLTGQAEQLEARGMDVGKGTVISAQKKLTNKLSTGQKAKKMLSGSVKTYIDPTITSKTEAQNRVDSLAEQMTYSFGSLDAICVGLPELVPGRFIRIKNLGGAADNTFYLQKVRHIVDRDEGYTTILTGQTGGLDFTP